MQKLHLISKVFPELLESDLKNEIAESGTIQSFQQGEVIMDYGSYVRYVPLVVEGAIKVVREDESEGKEILLYYLYAGDTCSMSFSCCMSNKKSDIKTIAEDETTVIAIPIAYVDQWISSYPSWKRFVMKSYDNRMKELIHTISAIAFTKLDERLLNYLKLKSSAQKSKTIQVTHQEIALDLNASREAISRLLKQLEKNHVLTLERNRIHLCNG